MLIYRTVTPGTWFVLRVRSRRLLPDTLGRGDSHWIASGRVVLGKRTYGRVQHALRFVRSILRAHSHFGAWSSTDFTPRC